MAEEPKNLTERTFEQGGEAVPEPQRLMRAILSNDVVDYAHNDVANAARFFRDQLTKASQESGRCDGIFLQLIAMITMTAFALEGYVNFVGMKLIKRNHDDAEAEKGWKRFERKTARDKIKVIRWLTGTEIDWNKRPYVTVRELMDLRNMFAHPKAHYPEERNFEALGTEDELKRILRD